MTRQPFDFQKPANRPYMFTSFVSSIDGKIIVKEKGYWPIGSKKDYEYFTYLRAHADAIVDAKNTAMQFGKYTIRTINDEMYQGFRKEIGKEGVPEFIILTTSPDEELASKLANDHGYKPTILTNSSTEITGEVSQAFNVEKVTEGAGHVQIADLIRYLNSKGHQNVFIDGGPTLIAQLLQENVLDEVHLTIAPKIFGSLPGKTLTMTEGILFPSDAVPQFELLNVEKLDDEVVLRYRRS
ncbi:RibD family protein [Candidatus Roizmanbacteria bacterium]|nr:MAG: RibD family protein [Candidatus Roizmanbacteria bacterium]